MNLTEWERGKLSDFAATQAVTYAGHYYDAGLFRQEIGDLNNWRRLAAKLQGLPEPEELPYRGMRRNDFNPEAD